MDQKIEFALKALNSGNFRRLCRDYGISAKTGYKWKERFLAHGLEGLHEASLKPQNAPTKLSEEQICGIILLKNKHPYWGPLKLREVYQRQWGAQQTPSLSSFKRVLERTGLVVKRRIRPAPHSAIRLNSGRRGQAPNEVWSVDFKGWWRDPEGQKCEPLTVRDEHSRYILDCHRLVKGDTEAVWDRFERLFKRHGLPQAIRSDNGSPFASHGGVLGLSRLSARWLALGIDLERGRPGCPQDNGAHERMHRDISNELQCQSQGWSQDALDAWKEEFNHQRPHQALGMKTPGEVYTASSKSYGGLPEDLRYEKLPQSRKISRRGLLKWKSRSIFISEALAGWSVGLSPREDGLIDLYFANLLLGQLEPATHSFQRAASGSLEAGERKRVEVRASEG